MKFIRDHERHDVLKRSLTVIGLLSSRAMTMYELAEAIDVDPRTVRRYIRALRYCGIDVEEFRAEQRGNPMVYGIRRPHLLAMLERLGQ